MVCCLPPHARLAELEAADLVCPPAPSSPRASLPSSEGMVPSSPSSKEHCALTPPPYPLRGLGPCMDPSLPPSTVPVYLCTPRGCLIINHVLTNTPTLATPRYCNPFRYSALKFCTHSLVLYPTLCVPLFMSKSPDSLLPVTNTLPSPFSSSQTLFLAQSQVL